MNKKEKNDVIPSKKKITDVYLDRQLPVEVKDSAIELFTKQSDELAETEAKNRKKRQKEKSIFITISGKEFDVDYYVSETFAGKKKHYFQSFYNGIADLLGESHDIMKPFRKPRIVALLKRKFILGRFPNAVQQKICKKNPYTGYCIRSYWNYQLLTKEGDTIYFEYIKNFEETAALIIEKNGTIKDFIIEHSIKCGIPIQLNFFENMGDR